MLSLFSRDWLFVTPWTVARQAPLSLGFSRCLPCPPPGDLLEPRIKLKSPVSPALQAVDSLSTETPKKPMICYIRCISVRIVSNQHIGEAKEDPEMPRRIKQNKGLIMHRSNWKVPILYLLIISFFLISRQNLPPSNFYRWRNKGPGTLIP